MMKQKILLFIAAFVVCCISRAQNISVADFSLAEHDATAMTEGTKVIDQNGEKCALIKIETSVDGFLFDVGNLGIKKVERHGGEIWLYVPHGIRKMTISHQQLGVLRDWSIPVSVNAGRTYVMKLTTGKVTTIVEEATTSQYLVFQVTPKDAYVELQNEPLVLADGTVSKYLPFGTYDYRVEAQNYHSEAGKITINDPNNKHVVTVNLKPAYGWIEITANSSNRNATVWIDGTMQGKVPLKTGIISSGTHQVKMVREKYKAYTETVTVTDNQTTAISPTLVSDFATVSLTADGNAEIWVNGEKKGVGSWSGDLSSGEYVFETKLAGHKTAKTTKTLSPSDEPVSIHLVAPTPIYGSLNVNTVPAMAEIYIDDRKVGESPMVVKNVLIGSHEVSIRKQGYANFNSATDIQEARTTDLTATLKSATDVTLNCIPTSATLLIDGVKYDASQASHSLSYGTHTISMKAEGYNDYTSTINVTENQTVFTLKMEATFGEKIFTVKGVSFTMMPVKAGTFSMGATSEQTNSDSDEKPVHQVTLTKDYYIGQTEVTQELWQAVMGSNPSYFSGSKHPVEKVSWNDCQTFISKLNSLTGKTFRLPTEAEWEFAARGGNNSKGYKYSGSNNIRNVAWYSDNSNSTTHDVATKQPNELGIYDMSGNVYEWCQDWYVSYSSSSQTDPTGANSGSIRVFRGGCWFSNAGSCRSARRNLNTPGNTDSYLGFRLVLSEL